MGGAWSRDGQRFAFAEFAPRNGGIRVVGADGGAARVVTRPRSDEMDSSPSWSPDGTKIAFARYIGSRRSGVWTVTLVTGAELQISDRFAGALDWSPAGDLIAADLGGEFATDVDLVRPSGGVERTILRPGARSYEDGASWSPDGALLAVGGGVIVDRLGRDAGRYASPEDDYVARMPAWRPDGQAIAYVRAASWTDARTNVRVLGYGDLYVWPVGGPRIGVTPTAGQSEDAPAWRPAAPEVAGRPQPCVMFGNSRRNVLRGTPLGDLIDGGGGNDLILARGGDDFVAGGRGSDVIDGGGGVDDLWGEEGNDTIRARDHRADRVRGGWGRDSAHVDRRLDWVVGVERVRR